MMLIKIFFLAAILYLGMKAYRYVSQIKTLNQPKTGKKKSKKDVYSKMDIQDAEFKDLEE